jgi:sodium/hydrogen exchanger 3
VEGCEEEERSFDSEVRVATLQFSELQIEFVVVVFILVVILAKLVWHHDLMHPVSNNIPESCMLIVVGAHIGGIILGSFYLDDCHRQNEVSPPFKFTPSLFFIYLLPPIVLEAGYFLNNRAFFENLPTILIYAVVGTLFNAFAVGLCLYGLFKADLLLTGTDSVAGVNFTISSALLFGTICAAVDPVAVLAVFEEIHVNKMLHILVFGESLLNDAVTIVLFQVLGAFANRPLDPLLEDHERDITVADAFLGIGQFIVVVVASIVIGLLAGMAGAFFTRFTEHVHVLEPIVVFAVGYLSYLFADIFAFSGIVSLIVAAMVMRHYVEANISRHSHTTLKYTMKVVSNVAEMVIFLFLGISLYDVTVHNWDTGLVIWTIVLVLLFRPIGVVLLTLFMNLFRVKKINWKSVFIMSYSGLRGAVAFSLALVRISDEPELDNPSSEELVSELQLRRSMLTAVTVLVLFTVFVQGTTIKPIVRLLKVRTESEHRRTMNEAIHSTALDHITAGMEDILGHVGHNRIREKIREIDYKYLRKIFERYPEARHEKILHTFKRLQYTDSAEAAEKNVVFKWCKDERFGRTHLSVYEPSPEPHDSATEAGNDQELTPNECEEHIPQLNDILKASFASVCGLVTLPVMHYVSASRLYILTHFFEVVQWLLNV